MGKLYGKLCRTGLAGLTALALSLALLASPAGAASYFVYDQWGGSWQDANKTAANTEDDLMCWAAAASNVLAWGKWGTTTYNTTDKMFRHFQDHWTDKAGFANWGWRWWLNGAPPPVNSYSYIDVPGGGNFFPTVNYYNYATSFSLGNMLASMDKLMHQGYGVTLSIKKGTAAHAITAWGFTSVISNGITLYNGIFITDSDDGKSALVNYAVTLENGYYYLGGAYTGWRITGLYGLKSNPLGGTAGSELSGFTLPTGSVAPTPISPSWLLVGTGLTIILLGRRRRRW